MSITGANISNAEWHTRARRRSRDRRRRSDRHLPGAQLRHAENRHALGCYRYRRRDAERPRSSPSRSYLTGSPGPEPDRPRRGPHRGHLAILLSRRVLAPRTGDDDRDRRGRRRAVGHPRQDGESCRCTSCSADARATGALVYGHANGKRHRRETSDEVGKLHRAGLQGDSRAVRRARASRRRTASSSDRTLYEPADERAARPRTSVDHAEISRRSCRSCSSGLRKRSRLRHRAAARRASPADADRSGAARADRWSRIACSGWKTRRRPRIRKRSS